MSYTLDCSETGSGIVVYKNKKRRNRNRNRNRKATSDNFVNQSTPNLLDMPMEILLKIFTYVGYDENLYKKLGKNPILCRVFSYIKTNLHSDVFNEYTLRDYMIGDRFKIFYKMLRFDNYEIVPAIRYYDHQIVAINNAYYSNNYSSKLNNIGHLIIPMNNNCYQDLSNMVNLQKVTINSITRCSWGSYDTCESTLRCGHSMKNQVYYTCLHFRDKVCFHYKIKTMLILPPNVTYLRLDDVDFTKLNTNVFEGCSKIKTLELYNIHNFGLADVKKLADTVETLYINNSDITIYEKPVGSISDGETTMSMTISKNIFTGATKFNNLTKFEYVVQRIVCHKPLLNLYDLPPSLEYFLGQGISLIGPINQKCELPKLTTFNLYTSEINTANLEIPESVKNISMRNVAIKHNVILLPTGLLRFSFDNNSDYGNILPNFNRCNSLKYFKYNETRVKFRTDKVRRALSNSMLSLSYIEYTEIISNKFGLQNMIDIRITNNLLIKKFFDGKYP